MSPRSSSIARRLAQTNMVASGAALVLACFMLAIYDYVTFRATMLNNRAAQAQIVGSNSVTALIFDDPAAAESTLAALKALPHIEGAALLRPNGAVFASYLRSPSVAPLQPPAQWATAADWHAYDGLRTLHVTHLVVEDGKTIGIVYIRSDLQEVRDRLVGYGLAVVGVLFIAILTALLVGRAATRSISSPMIELAGLATKLSADKDYSVRARSQGDGELGVLIASFNEMLAQIQARDQSLQESQALLERRVEERTQALHESNSELEAFCYSVSHDLRSPLRSIDGFSQALVEDIGETLDAASLDHLRRVRAATQRMGMLIDDLLNLSRISRTELTFKPVDLSAMAQSVIDELAAAHPDRRVTVEITAGHQAMGDPRLLRQVFENLLGNAWKFTGKQSQARIEFAGCEEAGGHVYCVKDNGAGFDPAYAERLFGVFQRMHSMTDFPGTGVGLAIVDRIIKRHGGRIWADAAVGRGAAFYFTLRSSARL